MADVFLFSTNRTGATLYFQVLDTQGYVLYGPTQAFEAYTAAHWADYAIAMYEQGSSYRYYGTLPGVLADDSMYNMTVFRQAGASPAEGDMPLYTGPVQDIAALAATAASGMETDILAAIDALLDSTDLTAIANAVWAKLIDGDKSASFVLRRLLAKLRGPNSVPSTSPLQIRWLREDAVTVEQTLQFNADGTTEEV